MAQNEALTTKQKAIYDFIKSELIDRGYPPSVREICDAVGLSSTSSVHSQLAKLEEKRYIRRDPSKPRAIEILSDDEELFIKKDVVNIPIIGTVAAGTPILAQENIEDVFPLSKEYLGEEDCFVLHVKGDSMINAGILDGDYVIVRSQTTARNGEMVVALIDDEAATVKTFYKESDHFRLQPENDFLDPIIVTDLSILGKVIGVYRNYLF